MDKIFCMGNRREEEPQTNNLEEVKKSDEWQGHKPSEQDEMLKELQMKNHELQEQMSQLKQKYDSELNKKEEEIEWLRRLNTQMQRKKSHQQISDDFYQHYSYLEMELSKESKKFINRKEFCKICCILYQELYLKCHGAIQEVFQNSLIEITKLSKEEEESGEVDIGRQRSLINAKAAYEYLLIHCETELNKELDRHKDKFANEVLSKLSVDKNIISKLHVEAKKAVDICWKMLTVSPPMFLCQPEIYSEEWHIPYTNWHDPPGELIYYKPVVMYSAGGLVAHKGLVGSAEPKTVLNTHQCTDKDVSSPISNPDHSMSPTTCSVCGGRDSLTDGHCTNCYKNSCDRSRQEQLEKTRVVDYDESLRICSICKLTIMQNDEPGKIIMEEIYYHQRCFICCKCNKKITHDVVVLCDGSIIWCNECAYTCHFCKSTLSGKRHLLESELACENCVYQRQKEGCDPQSLLIEHKRITHNMSLYHWRQHTCSYSCNNTL